MNRLNSHCFKCGSPVVETLTDRVKPVLSMNVVRFSCGAIFMGSVELSSKAQRFFQSGCGDRDNRIALYP